MVEVHGIGYAEAARQKIKDYVSATDEALRRELDHYNSSRFHGPLVYALQDGKRLRPLILLLSTDLVNGNVSDSLDAAVAVELLHTESIIHDDIIDQEETRRGRMAFHRKYGYDTSLLTADFVFGMILNIASRYEDQRIVQELSSAALRMCEGEFDGVKFDLRQCKLAWDGYIDLIQRKTASLFEVSAKLGGIIGGASESVVGALSEYGMYLGTAYQIEDDLLDWGVEGRASDALILTLPDGDSISEYIRQKSNTYASQAKHLLASLSDTEAKRCLLSLADLITSRNF